MGFRTSLITKSAGRYLQPGERLERVAIVRSAIAGDGRGNFAIAASSTHVHIFEMAGAGPGKVTGRIARIPIGKAVVERRPGAVISVGRRGRTTADHVFNALPGPGSARLVAFVKERGGNAG